MLLQVALWLALVWLQRFSAPWLQELVPGPCEGEAELGPGVRPASWPCSLTSPLPLWWHLPEKAS